MTRPALRLVTRSPAPRRRVLDLDLPGLWRGDAPVLGPLALQVAEGETVALTGPSGIGKTSLLRAVAGLEPLPTGGRLAVDGRLAMVFQDPVLLRWRRAARNIMLTAGVDRAAAERALADVGLAGLGERFPDQLSVGQQRRLSLARAFASRPAVLLMDEPFVSLDADLAAEMMDLYRRLRDESGVATILVTHVMAEAEALADRILRLDGRPARIVEERRGTTS